MKPTVVAPRARRPTLRAGALLAVPFLLVAIATGARCVVPVTGDWIARHLASTVKAFQWGPAAAPVPAPGGQVPLVAASAPAADGGDAPPASSGAAAAVPQRKRAVGGRGAVVPGPLAVHVPAATIQRAIDDAGAHIRARTTRGSGGEPAGIRLTGVSGLGLGLRDGDVIVAVEGKPTLDEDAATDVALSAIARGASSLHATAMRDDQPIAITADLPVAPALPAAPGKAR